MHTNDYTDDDKQPADDASPDEMRALIEAQADALARTARALHKERRKLGGLLFPVIQALAAHGLAPNCATPTKWQGTPAQVQALTALHDVILRLLPTEPGQRDARGNEVPAARFGVLAEIAQTDPGALALHINVLSRAEMVSLAAAIVAEVAHRDERDEIRDAQARRKGGAA